MARRRGLESLDARSEEPAEDFDDDDDDWEEGDDDDEE